MFLSNYKSNLILFLIFVSKNAFIATYVIFFSNVNKITKIELSVNKGWNMLDQSVANLEIVLKT